MFYDALYFEEKALMETIHNDFPEARRESEEKPGEIVLEIEAKGTSIADRVRRIENLLLNSPVKIVRNPNCAADVNCLEIHDRSDGLVGMFPQPLRRFCPR